MELTPIKPGQAEFVSLSTATVAPPVANVLIKACRVGKMHTLEELQSSFLHCCMLWVGAMLEQLDGHACTSSIGNGCLSIDIKDDIGTGHSVAIHHHWQIPWQRHQRVSQCITHVQLLARATIIMSANGFLSAFFGLHLAAWFLSDVDECF